MPIIPIERLGDRWTHGKPPTTRFFSSVSFWDDQQAYRVVWPLIEIWNGHGHDSIVSVAIVDDGSHHYVISNGCGNYSMGTGHYQLWSLASWSPSPLSLSSLFSSPWFSAAFISGTALQTTTGTASSRPFVTRIVDCPACFWLVFFWLPACWFASPRDGYQFVSVHPFYMLFVRIFIDFCCYESSSHESFFWRVRESNLFIPGRFAQIRKEVHKSQSLCSNLRESLAKVCEESERRTLPDQLVAQRTSQGTAGNVVTSYAFTFIWVPRFTLGLSKTDPPKWPTGSSAKDLHGFAKDLRKHIFISRRWPIWINLGWRNLKQPSICSSFLGQTSWFVKNVAILHCDRC